MDVKEKLEIPEEEAAFLGEMNEIKAIFDQIIQRIDNAGFNAGDVATPRMIATAKATITYMKQRVADLWVKEGI